jgi:hypothetical protein
MYVKDEQGVLSLASLLRAWYDNDNPFSIRKGTRYGGNGD